MPIKSYLAYPVSGRLDELTAALRRLPGCDVIPAVNRNLLVLVTDMPDEAAEEALGVMLADVPSLQALALVAGLGDEAINGVPPLFAPTAEAPPSTAPPLPLPLHTSGGRP